MKKTNLLLFTLGSLLITTPALRAADFSDFEAPTYTAGSTIAGTDGWFAFGSPTNYVTPKVTGDTTVLDGSQSAALDSGRFIGKTFASAGITLTNDTTISVLMNTTDPTATESFYFSYDAPDGKTPDAITFEEGDFDVVHDGGAYDADTGVSYTTGDTYKLSAALDFSAGTFTAYAQNLTTGGAVVDLGTYSDPEMTLAETNSSGGIIIGANGLTTFDDIEVSATEVPESSSMALMLVGLAALGTFRLKKHVLGV